MKNFAKLFTLLMVVAFFAAPRTSFAQEDGPKNVIKTNILSPILGSFNFFYERALSQKTSIQLGGGFTNFDITGTKLNGFRVVPEFRFYPSSSKAAPKGFFVGPFINYSNFNLTTQATSGTTTAEAEATLTTFGGGLSLGWQWIFGDIVALDLFFGPSFNSGDVEVSASASSGGFTADDFSTGAFSGFGFRFGLSLGIAF